MANYTHQSSVLPHIGQLVHALKDNNLAKVIELLHGLFKSIPNQIFIANREAYFHSVVYLAFVLLGAHIQSEVNFSNGRLDAIVQTPERLFIFEFKLYESAAAALQQIKDKDYAASYRHLNKTIVGVGVKFSETEKGMENWVSEDI